MLSSLQWEDAAGLDKFPVSLPDWIFATGEVFSLRRIFVLNLLLLSQGPRASFLTQAARAYARDTGLGRATRARARIVFAALPAFRIRTVGIFS